MNKSVLVLTTLFAIALAEDKAPKCDKGCYMCDAKNEYCKSCSGMGVIDGKCADVGKCNSATWDGTKMTCLDCLLPAEQVVKADKSGCETVDKKIAYCERYSSQTVCSKCAQNKFLSQDGLRCDTITPVNKCSKYSSKTQCDDCEGNSYLANNQCIDGAITNCLFTSAMAKCDTCIAGKSLTKGTTDKCVDVIKPVENCDYYADQKCIFCSTGYILDSTTETCTKIPEGCTDKACTACKVPNYYADYYDGKQICVADSDASSSSSNNILEVLGIVSVLSLLVKL